MRNSACTKVSRFFGSFSEFRSFPRWFSEEIRGTVRGENPRVFNGFEWWAWVDLNHRPRPYQGSVVRFCNLQDRGDCQTTRKSYKTEALVGWVVGWKESTNSETTPHSFPRTSFRIVSSCRPTA